MFHESSEVLHPQTIQSSRARVPTKPAHLCLLLLLLPPDDVVVLLLPSSFSYCCSYRYYCVYGVENEEEDVFASLVSICCFCARSNRSGRVCPKTIAKSAATAGLERDSPEVPADDASLYQHAYQCVHVCI